MKKYSVFVGGVEVNERIMGKEEAEVLAEEYENEGYDDVQIVRIY
jgi:hypothetical protein